MRRSRFRWRLLAVLLVLLPGCVQLTGQRITWCYDRAKDELQVLIDYDGIHDSGNDNNGKGTEQIPPFVREGNVMLLDWPFQLDMAELRKKADEKAEKSGPELLERDWARLFLSLKTEAVGYYREPDGRIGAVQRITVPRASEFLCQGQWPDQPPNPGSVAGLRRDDEADGRPDLHRGPAGAHLDRLDGQSIRIDVPVHPDEWAGFKVQHLHEAAKCVADFLAPKATTHEKVAYLGLLQGLTSAPISYLERDDRVEFVLGLEDAQHLAFKSAATTSRAWKKSLRNPSRPTSTRRQPTPCSSQTPLPATGFEPCSTGARRRPRASVDVGWQGGDAARKTAAIASWPPGLGDGTRSTAFRRRPRSKAARSTPWPGTSGTPPCGSTPCSWDRKR